jgi:hypothetical protein
VTGAELLLELMKLTPVQLELPVYSEGCDCIEAAHHIDIEEGFYDKDSNPTITAIVVTR